MQLVLSGMASRQPEVQASVALRSTDCGQVIMRWPTRSMQRAAELAAVEFDAKFTMFENHEWRLVLPPGKDSVRLAQVVAARVQRVVPQRGLLRAARQWLER